MKKSFKRVISCFLAVLMVMFAMPFSALAYSADEAPNWGLVFNAFTADSDNVYYNGTTSNTGDISSLNLRGVKDTPLVWDQSAKTLTLTKSMVTASAYTARYKGASDYQLQAGDYFTVTLTLDNVKEMKSAGLKLTWSGVEPASIYKYSYEDDGGTNQSFMSLIPNKEDVPSLQEVVQAWVDDGEAEEDAWSYISAEELYTKGIPISELSCGSPYTPLANVDWINASTFGDGEGDESYFNFGIAADNVDWVDVSSFKTQGSRTNRAKNPETGANAYAWSYRAPLATYLFKVTEPTNINFEVATPAVYGGTFVAKTSDAKADVFDYGFNYDPVTGAEYPTSCGMNFLGENVNKSTPEPTYPTVTIVTPEGYDNLTYTADASTTTYTVPELTAYTKNPDSTNHYTAQWKDNNVPTGTFGTEDETFEIEFASAAHTYGEGVVDPQPTCVTPGTETFTCTVCGNKLTQEVTDANAHNWGAWTIAFDDASVVTDAHTEANNTASAVATRVCANSASHTETQNATVTIKEFVPSTELAAGHVTFEATFDGATAVEKTVNFEKDEHVHNYNTLQEIPDSRVASTCHTLGAYDTAMYCACGKYDPSTVTHVELTEYDYTNHENLQDVAAKAATCTEDGNVAYSYCDACGKYYRDGAEVEAADVVVPAKNHDFSGAIDVNWIDHAVEGEGKWTATAVQHCVNDASHTTDVDVTVDYTHKDATKKEAGFDKWEAKVDGNVVDAKTETIAAEKINITVAATDLGSVDGDIITTGAQVTGQFDFGAKYNLRAVRPAGVTFVGWEINGKLVSQSESYSGIAYTDTTITPVFQETADDNINVFFYDKYGNTIKAFQDVSVADYQAAVAEEVPQGLNLPGYKFTGYDKADDIIKANDKSATFWAQYEADKDADKYTVNAPGADSIEAAAGTVDGTTATEVPYDTQVTVKAEGASAWAVNGAVVAYGDSYTFYVGSDITVTPVADAEVKPVVSIINTSNSGNTYTILATRSSGNATIVERGWIYGTVEEDALQAATVDDATAIGARMKRSAVTSSEQFSLSFPIKNAGTTVRAKAFIVDNNGEVYYSNIATVTK